MIYEIFYESKGCVNGLYTVWAFWEGQDEIAVSPLSGKVYARRAFLI